jgi:hypothetical protein
METSPFCVTSSVSMESNLGTITADKLCDVKQTRNFKMAFSSLKASQLRLLWLGFLLNDTKSLIPTLRLWLKPNVSNYLIKPKPELNLSPTIVVKLSIQKSTSLKN